MNNNVLMVDDDPNILSSLERHLRKECNITTTTDTAAAIEILKESGPFAVVVSDFRMPGMDGSDFLEYVKNTYPVTVRIMLTGQADLEQAVNIVNKGQIYRFLLKPCSTDELILIIQDGMRQYELANSEKDLLEKTLKGSVKTLFDILALISPVNFNQSARIRPLAINLAKRMGFENLWEFELGVLLSRIGCVTIPKEIIDKINRNEPLTNQEKETYYSHPRIGKSLVENIPRLERIAEGILYQYKQYSGLGIPEDSRKEGKIPFVGRMLKVLFDYDDYSEGGREKGRAIMVMKRNTGWYDPEIMIALEAEVMGEWKDIGAHMVEIFDLQNGMVLASDIFDKKGSLLVASGTVITPVLKTHLQNYVEFNRLADPIFVFDARTNKSGEKIK